VLIDGRTTQTEVTGMSDSNLLNLRDIDRVEIVLGPSSTLYGANAFSGVISIQTIRPSLDGHQARFALDSGVGFGNNGRDDRSYRYGPIVGAHGEYGYGWGKGGFRLSVGSQYQPSLGFEATPLPKPSHRTIEKISGMFDVVQAHQKWDFRAQIMASAKQGSTTLFSASDVLQQDYSLNLNADGHDLAAAGDRLTINTWRAPTS